MRWPEDITALARHRFRQSYPDWARGHGTWPLRIPLQTPTMAQRSESTITCHEWANAWAAYTGPGMIHYTNLRFPTGTHRMPATLLLSRPLDVAALHSEDLTTWRRCGQRLTRLQHHFPHARLGRYIRRITDLDDTNYERLLTTVTWLHTHPTSGMLLRQLPIEGIDTKWLARHAGLVLAALGDTPTPDQDAEPSGELPTTAKRALHDRLGLRVVPDLVQVSVCDPDLRAQLAGMRHLAATVADLNRWPRHPHTVVILENKETAFAVTEDHPGMVILHGHGFHVEHYARISWVQAAQTVLYWGDIDLPGLQFVSDLRALGVPARTILTDIATLEKYRHLAVEGTVAQRITIPPHLTDPERALYMRLAQHAADTSTGLLLEQERIPWDTAYPALLTAASIATPPQ